MNELFFQLSNPNSYLLFFILLLRIGGFVQTMPIFSSTMIPGTIKVFISIILAIFFYNFYGQKPVNVQFFSVIDYIVLAFKEIAIGVLLGMLTRLIFYAVILAADQISNVLGLSFANLYNPNDNAPSTSMGVLLEMLTVLLFLGLGFHFYLIEFIYNSFQLAPAMTFSIDKLSYVLVLKVVSEVFTIGILLAAPVISISLVVNIGLGFANRTITQLNVYIVGSLLMLIIGLLFLALSMPFFVSSIKINWIRIQPQFLQILQDFK